MTDPYIVEGWLNIAKLIGRSPRTARRWEQRHGFPVARLPDGSVATTRTLVDRWLLARKREQEERRRPNTAPSGSQP